MAESARTVAVIGAMDEEVALIAKSLENATETLEAGLTVTSGDYNTADGERLHVVATVAGMGTVNAASTTQHLIDVYQPEAVIFSGIAGNLNTHLHINDVVLGGTLRYLDTDMRLIAQSAPKTEEFFSDPHLLEVADHALNEMGITHIIGIIATGNYFVEGDENTSRVIRETGADAVEMEGAAVAHVAARNEVPVLVIRALSDNADTEYETFKEFDISEYADTAARLVLNILRRL
ncbi:5'-methylthioadenosine/S-adenosylhomocysteine nucleosidase [Bifidobacterium simiarum]|uniref:5'-methylthioadenosine/S-adenosylhomocysteine nucleosidase n=1 Tax=Bifidobacterium simiarum TaxID=2045441 RepID=UPI001BDCACAC|nr:5'-methylthioadenosine/S-adenosylhomocysteine nucleosidase [Bifidobacterium simiarum]MBT1166034.1 5'-methylthioadenosine/S-adenosylhomocysteine nucleosidase [Bifidobacterium simiarum]